MKRGITPHCGHSVLLQRAIIFYVEIVSVKKPFCCFLFRWILFELLVVYGFEILPICGVKVNYVARSDERERGGGGVVSFRCTLGPKWPYFPFIFFIRDKIQENTITSRLQCR